MIPPLWFALLLLAVDASLFAIVPFAILGTASEV